MVFSRLLDAARGLFELREVLSKARRDRKDRIASYLQEIGALLEDVARRIDHGEPPLATCAQLRGYSENLETVIGAEIEDLQKGAPRKPWHTAKFLAGQVEFATNVWEVTPAGAQVLYVATGWDVLQDRDYSTDPAVSEKRDAEIRKLYEASGIFTALGVLTTDV